MTKQSRAGQVKAAALVGRPAWRWPVLALVAWLAGSVLLFDPKLDVGGDNAVYLTLAESIATGQGYRDLHIVDNPVHYQYPVGFPVLLALLRLAIGRTSVFAAKLLVWLLSLPALWFGWRIVERLFRDRAGPVMLELTLAPALVRSGHQVLTEMPFLCVSLAALLCALRGEDEGWCWRLSAVLLAAGSLLLRTAGIGLVIGLGLALALRRRWWWILVLVALAAAVLVPAQVRGTAAGQSGTYIDLFLSRHPYIGAQGRLGVLDLANRFWGNFATYTFIVMPEALVPLLRNLGQPLVTGAAGGLLASLILLGLAIRLRRRTALEGYALVAGFVLLAWPGLWAGERFLVPVLPLLVIYLFLGLDWLGARLRLRRLVLISAIALAGLNACAVALRAADALPANLRYLRGERYAGYPADWRRFFEALDWVRNNTPADRVVMARKPEFVWLWTGHPSLCYPFTDDRSLVRAAVDRADYIVFDNFQWTRTSRDFLNPVLQDDPSRFPVLFETGYPQFYVLKVERQYR